MLITVRTLFSTFQNGDYHLDVQLRTLCMTQALSQIKCKKNEETTLDRGEQVPLIR